MMLSSTLNNINSFAFFPHQFSAHENFDSPYGTFPVTDPQISTGQSLMGGTVNNQQNICREQNFVSVKKPAKKDRHSKIYTAQGLRDRRVRLSIGIAREFFDLQDMLGFDKASKTLEWLLKKSRKAIEELVQMNGGVVLSEKDDNYDDDDLLKIVSNKRKSHFGMDPNSEMERKRKVSRAKARERARERTRVKLCNKIMFETKKCLEATTDPVSNQLKSLNGYEKAQVDIEFYSTAFANQAGESSKFRKEDADDDESKRERINSSSVSGYQQNHRTASNVNYVPNWPQNWDINSAIARSTFYAITNMNLSSGFHVYGKPW